MIAPIDDPPDAGFPTSVPPLRRTARVRLALSRLALSRLALSRLALSRRALCHGCLLAVLLIATSAWAGDPIPDIDHVLEQTPGGSVSSVKVDSPTGGFDEPAVGADAENPNAREIPWCRWWRPIPPVCRVKPQQQERPGCPTGLPPWRCTHAVAFAAVDGTVRFDLSEELEPGGSIALQYVDLYGDFATELAA